MSNAMTIDKDLTLKIESQIDDLRRYKDSVHLGALLVAVEQMLGSQHLLVLQHFPLSRIIFIEIVLSLKL